MKYKQGQGQQCPCPPFFSVHYEGSDPVHKDLFFRINAFVINLPPLREKREDIPLLVNYFLQKFARGGKKKRFPKEAMELLTSYGWPGNVRELANIIERSVLLSAYEEITVDDFTFWELPGRRFTPKSPKVSGKIFLTLAVG